MNILDIFTTPEFIPPLIAGIALAAACAILSVLIVLKRLAFIGQGISHAGFGGIGLAAFLAFSVNGTTSALTDGSSFLSFEIIAADVIVFLVCVASAIGIGLLSRRSGIKIDTAIGILLVATMAIGILLEQARWQFRDAEWYIALTQGRALASTDWHAVLFGSILSVSVTDMWIAIAVSAIAIGILWLFSKEIVFYAFDERVSRVFGVPSGFIHYLILILMAVLVVQTMKLTGLILVNAFLIIPGATATLLSRNMRTVLFISVAVAEIGIIGGYLLTFQLGGRLPMGPIIVLMLAVQFVVVWMMNRIRNRS